MEDLELANKRRAPAMAFRRETAVLRFKRDADRGRYPAVPPGGEFKPGTLLELFPGLVNITPHNFDVADLGRRFLVATSPQSTLQGVPAIVVTVNWTSGLPVAR